MSLEQLIFIALFILVPLVRAIAERRNKQRETEAEGLFETTANTELPGPAGFEPPAWPGPTFPRQAPHPPAPLPSTQPAPSVRPAAPEPPRRALVDPARSLRTARARSLAAVPQNRAELRRALLLVEILGPPRALEPRGR